MKITRKELGPTGAKKLLEVNTNNRPSSQAWSSYLSRVIRRGEWEENGDTIKVHKDGWLIDGQHRLQAIVLSGRTVPVWIASEVNGQAFNTIGEERGRTFSQLLRRDGEHYASILATAVRYYDAFRSDQPPPNTKIKQRLTFLESFRVLESAGNIRTTVKNAVSWNAGVLGSIGILSGAYHACRDLGGGGWADEFWHQVLTGEEMHSDDTQFKLRKRLIQDRASGKHDRLNRETIMALITKAWNCYACGEVMTSCRITGSDLSAVLNRVEEE